MMTDQTLLIEPLRDSTFLNESSGDTSFVVVVPKNTKKQIRERNQNKQRTNMCRISKYIHIIIFEFLDAKEIFKVSMISRSLLKSTKEQGVWERYFPDEKRMRMLINKEMEVCAKSKPPREPKNVKQFLMEELNVVGNLNTRKRY